MQDASGQLREVTADDCTALQLRLAPRIAARGSPSWTGHGDEAEERCVRAHALVGLRGAARVDSQLIISGERGGIVLSFGDGSLTVTDAAGKVGGPAPCPRQHPACARNQQSAVGDPQVAAMAQVARQTCCVQIQVKRYETAPAISCLPPS